MKVAPSLLSADFGALRDEARSVERLTAWYHVDVMDGHFVPNLTIGPPVVNSFRRGLARPLDIHLMVEKPERLVPQFDVTSHDCITFHIEAADPPARVVDAIRRTGAGVGITLRPGTPLDKVLPWLDEVRLVLIMSVEPGFGGQSFMPGAIDRIVRLRQAIGDRGVIIAVDGGISPKNVAGVVNAGAELIVAGSAIFGSPDPLASMRSLLRAAQ